MDKKEIERLSNTVEELSKWRDKQDIRQEEHRYWMVRCWAVIGLIWAGFLAIGNWAVDNFEVARAMVDAGIKAKWGK